LIDGERFENPFGLTTPKGDIRMMSSLLDLAVFLETKGTLMHIAAKAVAFGEALKDEFFTLLAITKC
jgi:glycine hydroxymethyltransferase